MSKLICERAWHLTLQNLLNGVVLYAQGLETECHRFILLCKRSLLWLKMFKGEKEKKKKIQIVPLLQGKEIAIWYWIWKSVLLKTGDAVRAILSTQLWNFWGGYLKLLDESLCWRNL